MLQLMGELWLNPLIVEVTQQANYNSNVIKQMRKSKYHNIEQRKYLECICAMLFNLIVDHKIGLVLVDLMVLQPFGIPIKRTRFWGLNQMGQLQQDKFHKMGRYSHMQLVMIGAKVWIKQVSSQIEWEQHILKRNFYLHIDDYKYTII